MDHMPVFEDPNFMRTKILCHLNLTKTIWKLITEKGKVHQLEIQRRMLNMLTTLI